MGGFHVTGWGLGMMLWLAVIWVAVLVTTWIVFRGMGGPKHHTHA